MLCLENLSQQIDRKVERNKERLNEQMAVGDDDVKVGGASVTIALEPV